MFCIVSYDLPDDGRRLKLSKILLDFGDRVQYSVFECILKDKKMLDKMKNRILYFKFGFSWHELCINNFKFFNHQGF